MEVDDDEQDGVLRRFRGPKDGPEEGSTKDSLTAFPGDALGSPAVCYGRALAQGWPRVVVDACGLCGLEAAELVEAMDDACGQVGMGLRKLLRGARQKYDMARELRSRWGWSCCVVKDDGDGAVENEVELWVVSSRSFYVTLCTDWQLQVVLMAGTNDLQEIRSAPAPIATCIKCLHTACHVEGVATVCLSVPPNRYLGAGAASTLMKLPWSLEFLENSMFVENPRYRERWARVNELLSTWSQGEGKHEGVALHVDVQQILPYGSESSLWDSDGLHFSQRGAVPWSTCEGYGELGQAFDATRQDTLGRALLEPLRRAAGARLLPAAAPSALAQPMPMRLKIPGKDSLTAGYHGFGRLFAPYAEALGCELQLQEPNEWVCGLSGLEATELEERLLSEKSFDLAFIMLGTNDLASGLPSREVAHRDAQRAAQPSGGEVRGHPGEPTEGVVNELLLNWAKETPMTHFVDTGDLLPWSRDSEHWEIDGLHFSRLGSRLLGQRLAQRLAPELRALGARRCKRW
eukprot:Skav200801  [mRNA]  locus=scaffold2549:110234:126491:- [translate_table: standard]